MTRLHWKALFGLITVTLLISGTAGAFAGASPFQRQRPAQATRGRQTLQEIVKPLLKIKDEAVLDAALAKLVTDNRITQEQAARIKEQWRRGQDRRRDAVAIGQLWNIEDDSLFNQTLSQLIADGRITLEQAARITEQRDARKQKVDLRNQLLQIRDEAKLNEALAQLISKGLITPQEADRIKEQWRKRLRK
jgi:hypothetical protein